MPLFQLTLGQEDIGVSPKDTTERHAYDLLTAGFGVGYNGPLLIANTLDPVATPSARYTKKYDKATKLQKQLEREQQRLQAQADALKAQQASLERQQAQLQRRGAALQARKAELERVARACLAHVVRQGGLLGATLPGSGPAAPGHRGRRV